MNSTFMVAAHRLRLLALALALVLNGATVSGALAQTPSAAPTDAQAAKVKQLFELLDDPAVRSWVARQDAKAQAAAADEATTGIETLISDRLAAIEKHFALLLATVPQAPEQVAAMANRFRQAMNGWSAFALVAALAALLAAGIGAAAAFRFVARPLFLAGDRTGSDEDVRTRLRKVALNLLLNLGEVAVAAIAAGAVFVLIGWPGSLGLLVLPFAVAALALHLVAALADTAFARRLPPPTSISLRAVPLEAAQAAWWRRWLLVFAAIFVFGWAAAIFVDALGGSRELRRLLLYALGIGLVAVALTMVWRRDSASTSSGNRRIFGRIVMSGVILLIWLAWVAGAKTLLGLLLVGTVLVLAIMAQRTMVAHLLRPAPTQAPGAGFSPVLSVAIDRLVRSVLIVLAMAALLDFWGIGFIGVVGGQQGPLGRIVQAVVQAIAILLVVDLAWRVISAAIENALTPDRDGAAGPDDLQRQARLRTLLPILRNVIGVALLVLGVLMALSAFGVEIGPLIAGAGVVGVAVGFGAQTLVRDVFSGIFYLLDDAFRVGEYIQSGSYRGTVEAFSLRSVKLRHHRGPLFTVPFGELGAVQNMSRDWVIDKMVISVVYGSDFDRAKKIVKQIGRELAEDPTFGPDILEPLKMQGVESFGDFGVNIRIKMVTKPGKQFGLRRRANSMIKKRFDEAGIAFAVPVVQVAGDGPAAAAAAHAAITHKDGAETARS